jgi:hypothetical protein
MLLENERLLLILADRNKYTIYLEHLSAMDAVIQRGSAIKPLNRKRVGDGALFAYDEAKRTLTVCDSAKVSPILVVAQSDSSDALSYPLKEATFRVCF